MKVCKSCGLEKDSSEFSKNCQQKDGLRTYCKSCISIYSRKYIEENKEKVISSKKKYYYRNIEKIRQDWQDYRKKNQERERLRSTLKTKYRSLCVPKWLTEEQNNLIKNFYKSARELAIFHEEQYHIDHIEPLKGRNSCGLHVPWNLQILPAKENLSKGNKLIV